MCGILSLQTAQSDTESSSSYETLTAVAVAAAMIHSPVVCVPGMICDHNIYAPYFVYNTDAVVYSSTNLVEVLVLLLLATTYRVQVCDTYILYILKERRTQIVAYHIHTVREVR